LGRRSGRKETEEEISRGEYSKIAKLGEDSDFSQLNGGEAERKWETKSGIMHRRNS